ncbi:MAG: PorT family protein [Prevotellaceae bacterium]|jgi:hypothetical protein|nr:PorT family protein [Prevotellaceae bacterium]
MKKILFITLILVASLEASAQQFRFGIKGGWDFENFDIGGKIGNQLKNDKSTAWNVGAVGQVHLVGSLYLQPELLYSTQKNTMIDTEKAKAKHKVSYFQVPVSLLFKFGMPVVNPYLSCGGYFGYAIDRNNTAKHSLKKTDWGARVGAGVEIWKLQVSANYNWALQNISDISDIKWKNNKFNVSVAFFIL